METESWGPCSARLWKPKEGGLDKAREIGLERVLISCDTDNIPSVRVIEANGGVLENQLISIRSGKMTSRYCTVL